MEPSLGRFPGTNGHGVSQVRLDEIDEAAFHAFAKQYPPDGVKSLPAAQQAWAQTSGRRPELAVMLQRLDECKRSRQWQAGKIQNIENWLRAEMWSGGLGKGDNADRRPGAIQAKRDDSGTPLTVTITRGKRGV
jgi:hypothetical protein